MFSCDIARSSISSVSRRPLTRAAAAALLALSLLAFAGCGKSNEDQIRDVGDEITAAGQQGDYAAACSHATARLLAVYGGVQGCATALAAEVQRTRFDFRAVQIQSVSVLGDRGVVTVAKPFAFQVAVEKVDGEWKVAGV